MTRGALFTVLLVACGNTPKDPEVIVRELPARQVSPTVVDTPYVDPLDAGGGVLDAGCCLVPFALTSTLDEITARIVFPNQTYPMDRDDAGVWRGAACLPPRPEYFYFQVGFLADDDAGVLFLDRVNESLPVETSGGFAPAVNLFEGGDGGVCSGVDLTRYVTLPDGG